MSVNCIRVYEEALEAYRRLSDTEFGRAIRAALQYMKDETVADLSGKDGIMYDALCRQVDLDRVSDGERAERNRVNGSKGGRPRKTQNNPVGFSKTQRKEKEIPPYNPLLEKDKEPPVGASPTAADFGGVLLGDSTDTVSPPNDPLSLSVEEARALQARNDAVLDKAARCGFPQSERMFERLNMLCDEFTAEWVMIALDQAADSAHGTPSISFLRAILDRFRRQGGPDDAGNQARAAPAQDKDNGYLYELDPEKDELVWEGSAWP